MVTYELTTPEQHLAITGNVIDYYYITAYWSGNDYELSGQEIVGRYDNMTAAISALASEMEYAK